MDAGDLTTLTNVKAWLSPPLTTTTDDILLTRLITAASRFIESWLGRSIASQTYTEIRDGRGGIRLFLRNRPVTAVSSLSVDGTAIAPMPAPGLGAGYRFDDSSIGLVGYAFTRGAQNVAVTYTAGFASTPPDIEQACIELVALRYKERDRIGHVSKSLAGETVSFTQRDLPADVQTLLDQYRNVVPA